MRTFIATVLCCFVLGGCSSSTNLSALSENNVKAGRYYESIGQPQAAQRAYDAAQKHKKQSQESEAIIFDILWSLFTDK